MIGVILTMLVLGLLSAPHCITMCGVICQGMVGDSKRRIVLFHTVKISSYVVCAVIFSLIFAAMEKVSASLVFVRYFILVVHAIILFWGLVLIFRAQLPRQLDTLLNTSWRRIHYLFSSYRLYLLASAWGLFPCGVLIVAYTQSVLTGSVFLAALGMFVFGVTSSLMLLLIPTFKHLIFRTHFAKNYQDWGLRIAGCFLVVSSTTSIYHLFAAEILEYCFAFARTSSLIV